MDIQTKIKMYPSNRDKLDLYGKSILWRFGFNVAFRANHTTQSVNYALGNGQQLIESTNSKYLLVFILK